MGKNADMRPLALRCEYLPNPLGMETLQPRLYWTLEFKAARRNADGVPDTGGEQPGSAESRSGRSVGQRQSGLGRVHAHRIRGQAAAFRRARLVEGARVGPGRPRIRVRRARVLGDGPACARRLEGAMDRHARHACWKKQRTSGKTRSGYGIPKATRCNPRPPATATSGTAFNLPQRRFARRNLSALPTIPLPLTVNGKEVGRRQRLAAPDYARHRLAARHRAQTSLSSKPTTRTALPVSPAWCESTFADGTEQRLVTDGQWHAQTPDEHTALLTAQQGRKPCRPAERWRAVWGRSASRPGDVPAAQAPPVPRPTCAKRLR